VRVAERPVALTGAAGGLGSALARELSARGARLLLVDREAGALAALADGLGGPARARTLALDLTDDDAGARLAAESREAFGRVDVLVNNAGLSDFTAFERCDPARLRATVAVNVAAPMLLARAVLPDMLARGEGWIVNVGSILGSIGFPYFVTYSTTKFAMHGFSQALRRELAPSGVRVVFVAPRAIRTPMSDVYGEMAAAVGMTRDPPADVAPRIADALERERAETFLGGPERLFVRVNGLLTGLVDRALRAKTCVMERFARPDPTSRPPGDPAP